MSDHECAGVTEVGETIAICSCVSLHMYGQMDSYFRNEFIKEVTAFASEYHHHVEGRDVVIVEQLLDFLRPVKGDDDGLGTT